MSTALYRPSAFSFWLAASASVFAAAPDSTAPACACCVAPVTTQAAVPAAPSAPVGHPLRGVVVAVLTEKQALLVKHEEIPGVMRAMTMLLKVDAATLAAAKKDQVITATLVRQDDGWWLRDVRPAAPDA